MIFVGEIKGKRMKEVMNVSHFVIVRVVKSILGDETNHKYRVNMEIPVAFVAIVLHFDLSKNKIEALCRKVLKAYFLGDLSNVLHNIDENLTIRKPMDYNVTIRNGKPPPRFPISYPEEEKPFKARKIII